MNDHILILRWPLWGIAYTCVWVYVFLKPNSSKELTTAARALASSPELANCHLLKLSWSFSKLVVKREYPAVRLLSNAELVRLCALVISSSWTFPCSSSMKLSFCQSQSFDVALTCALSSASRVLVWLPAVWCPVLIFFQGPNVRFWNSPRGLISGFDFFPGVECPVLEKSKELSTAISRNECTAPPPWYMIENQGYPSQPCKIEPCWFFLPSTANFKFHCTNPRPWINHVNLGPSDLII